MTTHRAQFPGRQYAATPLEAPPLCHFDQWPIDPDGYLDTRPPIGSASDGPDSSGRPLEYMRYLVYGFLIEERKLWVEPDQLMVPSSGGIDGYVAHSARQMHGVYPYRYLVSLDKLRHASISHRPERHVSSLHSSRCDHPLVHNGEPADRHLGHGECFELYVCNRRASDLALRARVHGDECDSFRVTSGFCDAEGKARIRAAALGFEHAQIKRVQDNRIVLRTFSGENR
ncbi:hypothetical protein ACIRPQ_29300 [Streptomyces sp. NPDC101213]|uniref:hypothetical protein n=1 Tax=Streptomyces sp. NPDC101213 TaxID=3366130 RepID=UPI0037FF9928